MTSCTANQPLAEQIGYRDKHSRVLFKVNWPHFYGSKRLQVLLRLHERWFDVTRQRSAFYEFVLSLSSHPWATLYLPLNPNGLLTVPSRSWSSRNVCKVTIVRISVLSEFITLQFICGRILAVMSCSFWTRAKTHFHKYQCDSRWCLFYLPVLCQCSCISQALYHISVNPMFSLDSTPLESWYVRGKRLLSLAVAAVLLGWCKL